MKRPWTPGGRRNRARHAATVLGIAVALAVAACDASTPTGSPSPVLADITPAPLATAGTVRTPRPSFCVGSLTTANATEARIEFQGPRSWQQGDLYVDSITRLLDGVVLAEDATQPGAYDAGFLIGGAPLTLTFEVRRDSAPTLGFTDIAALYRPEGASWSPLALEPMGSGRSITIPDGSGSAQLRLDLTWTDGCFEYGGWVRFAFEVVPSAVAAACPSDAERLAAIVASHSDDRVAIGDIDRSIGTLSVSARYSSYDAADQVGQFGSWDPAAPAVEAATGELLAVADDDADLRLSGGFARFFRLTDPNATSAEDSIQVSETVLEVDATGRLQIESPEEEGRYILELSTSWELDCLTGGGLTYFTVDVSRVVGSLPRPSV